MVEFPMVMRLWRHPKCMACLLGVLACAWMAEASLAQAKPAVLIDLEGKVVRGTVLAIDDAGKISLADGSNSIKLNSLRSIELSAGEKPVGKDALADPAVVYLVGGGEVISDGVTLAADEFSLQTIAGPLSLSIDDVRAMRFGAGVAHPVFAQALREPDDEFDRFLTRNQEKLTTIRGFVDSIESEAVQIDLDGKTQALGKAKVYGVVLAAIETPGADEARHEIVLHDGSRMRGKLQGLAREKDGKSWLTVVCGASQMRLPWDVVTSIVIRSDRVQYLSQLEPVDVLEQPVVALPRRWKRDQNVLGRPLSIGEKQYSRGLGVQARSVLTFAAQGRYARFTATIGIDASTQGRGDCEFVIRGDGRELFRQRVKATDEAKAISIPMVGVERLQLIVEPGADLDFGDRANWCDACLVR